MVLAINFNLILYYASLNTLILQKPFTFWINNMANKKLKIRYIKAYDFKISLATGVFGGITANGLINANFFHERAVLPDSQIIEVDEKGVQQGKPVDEKEGDIMRELQTGILLDMNTTKVIIKWLEGKVREFEQFEQSRIDKTKK